MILISVAPFPNSRCDLLTQLADARQTSLLNYLLAQGKQVCCNCIVVDKKLKIIKIYVNTSSLFQ